jgi:hypothetical protein
VCVCPDPYSSTISKAKHLSAAVDARLYACRAVITVEHFVLQWQAAAQGNPKAHSTNPWAPVVKQAPSVVAPPEHNTQLLQATTVPNGPCTQSSTTVHKPAHGTHDLPEQPSGLGPH